MRHPSQGFLAHLTSKPLVLPGVILSAIILSLLMIVLYKPALGFMDCTRFQRSPGYGADKELNISGQQLHAEVADSSAEHTSGLSNRPCIRPNQAMLFVFPEGDNTDHCFWMKDMRFPIDMLWLDKDRRVVFLASEVSPSTFPTEYCPNMPTSYVLELPSGKAAELGLDYDDVVPL